jgi:hypothetical protein
MPPKSNPLKLNALQLRTLSLLQGLAGLPDSAVRASNGEVTIIRFPQAHGDHFHIGTAVVEAKNATGLYNEAVWNALDRKGLARSDWPHRITLTVAGLGYDPGEDGEVFRIAKQ